MFRLIMCYIITLIVSITLIAITETLANGQTGYWNDNTPMQNCTFGPMDFYMNSSRNLCNRQTACAFDFICPPGSHCGIIPCNTDPNCPTNFHCIPVPTPGP